MRAARGACLEGWNGGKTGGKRGNRGRSLVPGRGAWVFTGLAGLLAARKQCPERLVSGRSRPDLVGQPPLPFAIMLICGPAYVAYLYLFIWEAGEIHISERRTIRLSELGCRSIGLVSRNYLILIGEKELDLK